MRKRNKVKQLNKTASHRRAMMRNMATSLFEHERIVTTRARGKVLKSYAEKLITRAKRNLDDELGVEAKLHNKREIMRDIADRDIVTKLFDELAPRYKERKGGYTRMIHMAERQSDSAQMSVVELIDRKEKVRVERVKPDKGPAPKPPRKTKKSADADVDAPEETDAPSSGKGKKGQGGGQSEQEKRKWWRGFKKKKGDEH